MDYIEKISRLIDFRVSSKSLIRLSNFVHYFSEGNISCLYNAANLKRVFGNKVLKQLFQDLKEYKNIYYLNKIKKNSDSNTFWVFISKLIKDKFILIDDYTEETLIDELREEALKNVVTDNIFIYVTERCNLSCRYCYVQKNIPLQKEMNPVIAVNVCEYIKEIVKQQKIKKLYVIFYGGEPFLNLDVVKYITNTLDNQLIHDCNLYYRIITNGLFLDDNNLKLIQKLNIIPSVSLDGPKKVMLRTRTNTKQFNLISQGIKKLKENKINHEISFTISKGNIDCLVESVEYIIGEFMPSSIRINVPELNRETIGSLQQDLFKKMGEQIKDILYLLANSNIDCCNLGYENFKNHTISFFPCSGCGRRLAISPDGLVSRCESFLTLKRHIIGKINQENRGMLFNNKENEIWLNRSGYYFDDCKKCIALGLCAGGCAYNAELSKGNFFTPDYTLCEWARSLTREFIFYKFPKKGGEYNG